MSEFVPFVLRKTGTFVDRTARRYGRLTAVRPMRSEKRRGAYWQCVCNCGGVTIARADWLESGKVTSCGCAKSERAAALAVAGAPWRKKSVHGHAGTSRNKSASTRTYEYCGGRIALADFARHCGLKYTTAWSRLQRMTPEQVVAGAAHG